MDPVAYTALPIAAARANEHANADSMIVDPLARKLLAGENQLLSETRGYDGHMLKRTLIGDDLVKEKHSTGVRQVVSLGAGMDSRAFRLGLYDTRFFEVDMQSLFDVKEPLLRDFPAQCLDRQIVAGNLGSMDLKVALQEAGFNASQPSCWLLEGLVMYLTAAEMRKLATEIGKLAAPGSSLWHDAFSETSVKQGMSFYGAPFKSGLDDYSDLWRHCGFRKSMMMDAGGAWVDRRARKLQMDRRYEMSSSQLHGKPMCLLVRADK
eukprot:TRINITY_DN87156_c0_g1_i1.p1 TRINITY_DN87156_c0_g1~~TRINITY_DN87156_c0_g1_i1.p1  ORF type:complete len:286 (-),score=48.60 TRINITY_DN87156_c0_g1_i1:350-1144(-)